VAHGTGAALRHTVRRGAACDYPVRNARIWRADGVELEVTRAVTAAHPWSAAKSMKAAAVKTTAVEAATAMKASTMKASTMKASTMKASTMKASGVETATTAMETAAVETTAAMTTAAAMTAATRRIGWVREWCCHNRGHEDRNNRQQIAGSLQHISSIHLGRFGGPAGRKITPQVVIGSNDERRP
jgi:hypothetical protein